MEQMVLHLIETMFLLYLTNVPMHFAARFGRLDMVKWIFANGYEVNSLNSHGESPLHFACQSHNLDVVKFLVDLGLDMTLHTVPFLSNNVCLSFMHHRLLCSMRLPVQPLTL